MKIMNAVLIVVVLELIQSPALGGVFFFPDNCYVVVNEKRVDSVIVVEMDTSVFLNWQRVESPFEKRGRQSMRETVDRCMSDPNINKYYSSGNPTRDEAEAYMTASWEAINTVSRAIPARLNEVLNDSLFIAKLNSTVDSIQTVSPGLIRAIEIDHEYGCIHLYGYVFPSAISCCDHLPIEIESGGQSGATSKTERIEEFFRGLVKEKRKTFAMVISEGTYTVSYGDANVDQAIRQYESAINDGEILPGPIRESFIKDLIER